MWLEIPMTPMPLQCLSGSCDSNWLQVEALDWYYTERLLQI